MVFALTHLAGVSLLVVLFCATGFLIEAVASPIDIPALGPFVVRVTLGSIAWTYALFFFACVGLYRAAIALPLAGLVLCVALALAVRRTGFRLRRVQLTRGIVCILPPALIVLAIGVHATSLGIGWDDDVYHLHLPKLYLAHAGFRPVGFSVYSHWPHNVELLYGLAMMLQDYVLAKLVHTLFLALVVIAVFRICRRQGSVSVASAATLLVLGNPVVLFEAEIAYIDLAFAFYFLVAVACADEHLRSERRDALVLSGLCCGMLAGTKLTGLAGVGCIAVLVLLSRPLRQARETLRSLVLSFGLPVLVLSLPWYAKSYLYTGNPFYPFLFQHFGGIEWSAKLGQQFFDWQHGMGMGRSWKDYLLLPVRVVSSAGLGYYRFDGELGRVWWVALPLSIAVLPWMRSARAYLLCAGLYFVSWALASQQLRFLIAALPPLAIAAGFAADWLISTLRFPAARTWLRAAVLIGTCAALVPVLAPSLAAALVEAKHLFQQGEGDHAAVVPEGYAFINRATPAGSKIMLLNINRGFFLEREYIADSFFEASQMGWLLSKAKSQDDLIAIFKRLGVTHLYISRDNWGIAYPDALAHLLANRHPVKRIYRCKDWSCTIYQLRGR